MGVASLDFLNQLNAIPIWQAQIGKNKIRLKRAELAESLFNRARLTDDLTCLL